MKKRSGGARKIGGKYAKPPATPRTESVFHSGWAGLAGRAEWRPRTTLLHLALISVLCFVVYGNSLTGEFVWDDNVQIVKNETIRSLSNIPQEFTSSLWSFANANGITRDTYYRPLQNVIFTLTYQAGGLSPVAFHVVNVMLHAAASMMVYLLCLELGMSTSASLFAAAIFAVHPVHTEAVSWIAGLGEVACGLFYFAALWLFLRYLNSRKAQWLGLSTLCFFFALLSKEMAVTFPLVAMLMIRLRWSEVKHETKDTVLAIAPSLVALAAYGALRISAVGFSLPPALENHAGIFDWITFAVWMFGRYLRYAFIPFPLAAFHNTPLYLTGRIVSTCLYALVIAAVILLLWFFRKAEKSGLWWFCMFAAMLTPVFYFKGIAGGSFFAERYLYIPTLPVIALLTIFWMRLDRRISIIAAAGLIVVFSATTIARNRDWSNDERLYTSSLAVFPENVHACLNLVVLYLDAGRYSETDDCLKVAQKMSDPDYVHPRSEEYRLEVVLGTLATRRGISDEAKVHLKRAIEINPSASDAYTILAGVLMNLDKDFASAIPILNHAIELGPADDQARDSMGVAHYNLKQYEEAIGYFREALRINPGSERARQHLETALKRVRN